MDYQAKCRPIWAPTLLKGDDTGSDKTLIFALQDQVAQLKAALRHLHAVVELDVVTAKEMLVVYKEK